MELDAVQETSPSLKHGKIELGAIHLCVDMQRMFAEETSWKTPWMDRVRPVVAAIAREHAPATVFTRFIPASHPGEGEGVWRRYWHRWPAMTLSQLGFELVGLLPELQALCPPASVFDKKTYSPWWDGRLHAALNLRGCRTLVITGGETDVCVLATVLGAVDLGYRVIVVTDALCSSADETHDAVMAVYHHRYGQQIEAVTAEILLDEWR
jgi:nicotinamidase-related amidase